MHSESLSKRRNLRSQTGLCAAASWIAEMKYHRLFLSFRAWSLGRRALFVPCFVKAILLRFEYSIQLTDEFEEFVGVFFDGDLFGQLPPAFLGFGTLHALPQNLQEVWEELMNIICSG
jgi:hypothetical protein